jgi:hypothetical protein
MAGGEGLTMTLTAALLLSFLAGLLLAAGVYALLRAVLGLLLPADDAEPVTDQGQARATVQAARQAEQAAAAALLRYRLSATGCPYCGAEVGVGRMYCPECYRQVKGDAA